MVSMVSFSWAFFILASFVVAGKYFRDFTIAWLGGLGLFLLGLYVWISPLVGFDLWFSQVIGSLCWGVGAYIILKVGLEWIDG